MADDGHIAGLFPAVSQVPVSDDVIVCEASPKPPRTRISLSNSYLVAIPHRLVTVVGENKLPALNHVANGDELPITLVRPTEWFIESSLWSELRP
jgi:6-phosphogluconolactonase/glucosamine-6-phosphate isomerase/deaminase